MSKPNSLKHSIPKISLKSKLDKIDQGFNSAVISLDASLDSDLKWNEQIEEAKELVAKGYFILWDLKFGLFSELPLSLSEVVQYKSLHLALDHFFETVLSLFKEQTIGVTMYQGPIDLNHKWPWDVEQVINFRSWLIEEFETTEVFSDKINEPLRDFMDVDPIALSNNPFGENLLRFYCMRAALDYFEILNANFPSELLPYILFDAQQIKSPTHLFQLLDYEELEFMQLGLKNFPYNPMHAIGWESSAYSNGYIGKKYIDPKEKLVEASTALLIPLEKIYDPDRLKKIDELYSKLSQNEEVLLISERTLTMDWQGIDKLIVTTIDESTLRKLQGFVAAGGEVICAVKSVGLDKETHL